MLSFLDRYFRSFSLLSHAQLIRYTISFSTLGACPKVYATSDVVVQTQLGSILP
jgi:hypothetical protein